MLARNTPFGVSCAAADDGVVNVAAASLYLPRQQKRRGIDARNGGETLS